MKSPIRSWDRPEGVEGEVLVTWPDGSTTLMGAAVSRWRQWDKRLSNAELQGMTAPTQAQLDSKTDPFYSDTLSSDHPWNKRDD